MDFATLLSSIQAAISTTKTLKQALDSAGEAFDSASAKLQLAELMTQLAEVKSDTAEMKLEMAAKDARIAELESTRGLEEKLIWDDPLYRVGENGRGICPKCWTDHRTPVDVMTDLRSYTCPRCRSTFRMLRGAAPIPEPPPSSGGWMSS